MGSLTSDNKDNLLCLAALSQFIVRLVWIVITFAPGSGTFFLWSYAFLDLHNIFKFTRRFFRSVLVRAGKSANDVKDSTIKAYLTLSRAKLGQRQSNYSAHRGCKFRKS